ncbi:MAG: 2-C-methyl-D-erythritol 4-phosphate cytidylyltransferase, partial [Candidatus Auribacterota bacterium]|nr:2-C-methyl-D-erythritol 4-phosphate cytidylyltransferase [Candidatus Auribacterota bacterium]
VLIHDGVRPLIRRSLVEKVIEGVQQNDGVVPALKIIPTVKETGKNGYVTKTLVRENLVEVQTPQAFRYGIIKEAYKHVMERNIYITDDSAAVEMVGGRVKIVEGDYRNRKVTFPEDIEWLRVYMGL